MILETKARYFGATDSIQVAVVVQEDDATSAASSLLSGTVEILHGDTAMFTEQFSAEHVALWFDGDTNYEVPEDRGEFYFFLHHPPVQQNINARVTVLLQGDRTATQKVPVDAQLVDAKDWQNPALKGRDQIAYQLPPEMRKAQG